MSKYLKFKRIPFKGKTKKYEVISKTSFDECKDCEGTGKVKTGTPDVGINLGCFICLGEGKIPLILGRIQWYSGWRQYTFSPAYPTIWNKDCLKTIEDFLIKLMEERKINEK